MLVRMNPVSSLLARDNWLDDFFKTDWPEATRVFEPRVDIRENEKEFVISAELPGLSKDDFKLTVEDNVLTLEGEKKFEHEEKKANYYRSERSYGKFKRSFRLNDSVDAQNIKADYKNGVLDVIIPKAEKARPKEIDIKVK